jgi:hypothetical protein
LFRSKEDLLHCEKIVSGSKTIGFVALKISPMRRQSSIRPSRLSKPKTNSFVSQINLLCRVADCFVALTIAFDTKTIFLRPRQCSEPRSRLLRFSDNYFAITAIVFLAVKSILQQRRFSQSESNYLRPETDFSIAEKIAGEAPTIFMTTKQIMIQ